MSLCGYTDWRIPNVNELQSLVNIDQSNSATWLNSQGFSNVQESNYFDFCYWSSTTFVIKKGHGYFVRVVHMEEGGVGHLGTADDAFVLPVRSKLKRIKQGK